MNELEEMVKARWVVTFFLADSGTPEEVVASANRRRMVRVGYGLTVELATSALAAKIKEQGK